MLTWKRMMLRVKQYQNYAFDLVKNKTNIEKNVLKCVCSSRLLFRRKPTPLFEVPTKRKLPEEQNTKMTKGKTKCINHLNKYFKCTKKIIIVFVLI